MSRIDDLKKYRDALKGKSLALSDEEREVSELNAEIIREQKRLDEEMEARLVAECEGAEADLLASGYRGPYRAIYCLNTWKATGGDDGGVGWAIIGPGDVGKATEILKKQGQLDLSAGASNAIDMIVTDPTEIMQVVKGALLRSPRHPHGVMPEDKKLETVKALMGTGGQRHGFYFLKDLQEKSRVLAGAAAKTLAGK